MNNKPNAFKQARQAAGLTLDDIATTLGVSRVTVWEWETNHMPIPVTYRTQLKKILGKVTGIVFAIPKNALSQVRVNSTLAQARIDAGLTHHQLADAVGVSYTTIRNWENGIRIGTGTGRSGTGISTRRAGNRKIL